MKILIVSDIHGNYDNLNKIITSNSFDKLFILGDILNGPIIDGYNREGVVNLLKKYKDKISIVKGNCDTEEDFEELGFTPEKYVEEELDGNKFLLTHGHLFNFYNLPNINFNICIQGHTHIPVLVEQDNRYYLNPGSITLPKGMYDKSYAIYEDNKITLCEIDGKLIKSLYVEKEEDND
ncbi:MAG: phosphodiesterase [Bacilli bacterium]|nr:phosphodiesterase [Bacilli bacterium]